MNDVHNILLVRASRLDFVDGRQRSCPDSGGHGNERLRFHRLVGDLEHGESSVQLGAGRGVEVAARWWTQRFDPSAGSSGAAAAERVRVAVRVPPGATAAVCVPLLQFMDPAQVTLAEGACGALWAAGAPTEAAAYCTGLQRAWAITPEAYLSGTLALLLGAGEWDFTLSGQA